MSLGHWCFFVCTVTCSLVFLATELKHVTVQSFLFFLNWRSFKLKHLKTVWIHWTFLSQAITGPDRCPLSSSTTRPLQSTMATVTATTAGRTEQYSAITDRGLTDFPLGRFNQLVANTLRVPALAYESVSATELLAPTLAEFETAEINDLLLVTQAVTAVRTHCETLKNTALSQEWLPSTAVPGSVTDGLYGIRYAIPSPDSPCNCFSLAALHSRRCQNWQALKNADPDWTGFQRWCGHHWPDCTKHVLCDLTEHHTGCSGTDGTDHLQPWTGEVSYLIHCPQTAEQLDWHWRKDWSVYWLQSTVLGPLLDYWITSTGCSVEHCGVPHWIWDPTALHCQGTDGAIADGTELQQDLWHALQRTGWTLHPHCESAGTDAWRCEHWLCLAAPVHWWGTAGERGVEYTLNVTKLFWSRSGIMHVAIAWDHKPLLLLATALLPNRTTESFEREAGPPYDKQRILMGLRSGNTVLICFRSGVGHFQSVLIALAKKTGSRLATAHGETGTAKVDVKITGLPVGSEEVTVTITGHWDWVYLRDLWGNCFWTLLCWLMYWSLGSRFTEDAHLHTAPRLIDTVQLITDCVFHWLASMIDHCMHVQVCDTDSLNQCQGEVLRYTTAHSMTLSSILTAWLKPGLSTWLKSLTKRLTESTLVWLELLTVSCTGERS